MTAAQFALHQDVHTLYRDRYSWLRRRMSNAVDAADLANDAFLRLILKSAAKGFDSPVEARAYLRTDGQRDVHRPVSLRSGRVGVAGFFGRAP
ncbi:sigma factor [Burkholderia cepacia]|uniref:sigma factor n=1 Tax=Burkholderia cepacia TaxID=292 RepID=UPI001E2C83A3|nr:sigma factor [Burkholderia cepacia]